jgi:antitoxin PrlF
MTMATSTLTSKGQITLPRDVRQSLGLEAGDQVDFVKVDDGFKLVPVRKDVRELKGVFSGYVNRTVSLKEMDDAIARGASGIDD